ncbi:MAG: hypothetical protein M1828_001924 [Chrysothrix sp. TS-e1954]|nr:MAG: hypothetical protein M1828_001924 [Chrysothrix sp. TS-e1954]
MGKKQTERYKRKGITNAMRREQRRKTKYGDNYYKPGENEGKPVSLAKNYKTTLSKREKNRLKRAIDKNNALLPPYDLPIPFTLTDAVRLGLIDAPASVSASVHAGEDIGDDDFNNGGLNEAGLDGPEINEDDLQALAEASADASKCFIVWEDIDEDEDGAPESPHRRTPISTKIPSPTTAPLISLLSSSPPASPAPSPPLVGLGPAGSTSWDPFGLGCIPLGSDDGSPRPSSRPPIPPPVSTPASLRQPSPLPSCALPPPLPISAFQTSAFQPSPLPSSTLPLVSTPAPSRLPSPPPSSRPPPPFSLYQPSALQPSPSSPFPKTPFPPSHSLPSPQTTRSTSSASSLSSVGNASPARPLLPKDWNRLETDQSLAKLSSRDHFFDSYVEELIDLAYKHADGRGMSGALPGQALAMQVKKWRNPDHRRQGFALACPIVAFFMDTYAEWERWMRRPTPLTKAMPAGFVKMVQDGLPKPAVFTRTGREAFVAKKRCYTTVARKTVNRTKVHSASKKRKRAPNGEAKSKTHTTVSVSYLFSGHAGSLLRYYVEGTTYPQSLIMMRDYMLSRATSATWQDYSHLNGIGDDVAQGLMEGQKVNLSRIACHRDEQCYGHGSGPACKIAEMQEAQRTILNSVFDHAAARLKRYTKAKEHASALISERLGKGNGILKFVKKT